MRLRGLPTHAALVKTRRIRRRRARTTPAQYRLEIHHTQDHVYVNSLKRVTAPVLDDDNVRLGECNLARTTPPHASRGTMSLCHSECECLARWPTKRKKTRPIHSIRSASAVEALRSSSAANVQPPRLASKSGATTNHKANRRVYRDARAFTCGHKPLRAASMPQTAAPRRRTAASSQRRVQQ